MNDLARKMNRRTTRALSENTTSAQKHDVKRLSVDIPAPLMKHLKTIAVEQGVSLRELTISALENDLARYTNPRK